jgi:hypothetical protein
MPGPHEENKTCAEFERLLVLYACEELEAAERAAVEEHAGQCAVCATQLARELRLRQALAAVAGREEPSELLLAQCRSELEEAIDDRSQPRARPAWLEAIRPSRWFVPSLAMHPALSAALLVLVGVVMGVGLPQWYRSRTAPSPGRPTMTVSASRLSEQDLQTMGIAGINWVPDASSGSLNVELRLIAEKPLVVQGSAGDNDVKRVLTFVVLNGQRFDSGVRLDSVDVLRTRSSDRDVRQTLCAVARKDSNPGVRLRALEALHGFEQDDLVRQTLLDTLLDDANPGARVEAINSLQGALRAMGEQGPGGEDQRLVEVLRDRMQKDPNNYVRLQSAAAIRQLGPRQLY